MMEAEHGDVDSDDSADTVVASGELRSRWREQTRRLHPSSRTDEPMAGRRNAGDIRNSGHGTPVEDKREVKKEVESSGDPPCHSGDKIGVMAAQSSNLVTANKQAEASGSNTQGWSVLNSCRPIKTEQLAVGVVPPFNVKLESAPETADRGVMNPSPPVSGHVPDKHGSVMAPLDSLTPNHSSNVLSGSDSDFDEQVSENDSEMDGFDDFLEGITRELNDGMYSDLRDKPASVSPLPCQVSEAANEVVVKSERQSPSCSNLTGRPQFGSASDELLDGKLSNPPKASVLLIDLSFDDIPDCGKENAPGASTEFAASQQSAAHRDMGSESFQPDVSGKDMSQASTFDNSTSGRYEHTQCQEKDCGSEILEKGRLQCPAAILHVEETSVLQMDGDRDEATLLCSSQEKSLQGDMKCEELAVSALSTSSQLVSCTGQGAKSSVTFSSSTTLSHDDDTSRAKDVVGSSENLFAEDRAAGEADQEPGQRDLSELDVTDHASHSISSLEPGKHKATGNVVEIEPRSSEVQIIANGPTMIDQGIQVNSIEDGIELARKESHSSMAILSASGKKCEMVDTDTQTDPASTLTTMVDFRSPSLLPGKAADGSAKHINDYCEKTFWLLENFSEGLSKEDDSHKTRSVLGSAKEVRDGLNKRHGLPLSQQLNLCTNAVRSMLNALRKLSKRSSRRAARRNREIETKEKPTEVVQPYMSLRDRIGCLPSESTRPSDTGSPGRESHSRSRNPSTHSAEPNLSRTGNSGTTSDGAHHGGSTSCTRGSPLCRSGTERSESKKGSPKPEERKENTSRRVTLREDVKKESVWATRLLPSSRKRIVEDGYGLSFLDALPNRQTVDALFATTFRRLGENYRVVFENRARLPEPVRKRMPESIKWQDIRSKRLKNELFTGFGIFLEELTDLLDEFLPLNPFHINRRPTHDASTDVSILRHGATEDASIAVDDGDSETQDVRRESHASAGVRHASGDMIPSGEMRYTSGGVRHASGASPRGTDVWEEQCLQFLEKIRPLGGTPRKADARQQNQGGRVPSPAAFVEVHGGEVPNPHVYPSSFPKPPTSRSPPFTRVRNNSATNVPSARCLISITPPALDSMPTSSGIKTPQSGVNKEDSDMSLSEGEENITGWTPPEAGGSQFPSTPGGGAANETRYARSPSRHVSGSMSATPPHSASSGSTFPHSMSSASMPDREADSQQIAQKILRQGLDLLDQPSVAHSSTFTPPVKRGRQSSEEDGCEPKKRIRQGSDDTSRSVASPDKLFFCEEHGIIHDDPWETFLHLSTRPDGSSCATCPLCGSIHSKTSILDHAGSVHGIRKPSESESDEGLVKSPTPDSPPGSESDEGLVKSPTPDSPPRRVTYTERPRRRSLSAESPRRHRTHKRPRHEERSHRRTGRRSSSRERPRLSSHHSSEYRWRRRQERHSPSHARPPSGRPPVRSRHRSASVESTCIPAPSRGRHRSASVESTRFPERSERRREHGSPRWPYDEPPDYRYERRSRYRRAPGTPPEWYDYSPPQRRSRRFYEDERDAPRHHAGGDRSGRRPSGEGGRRRPSPDRGSRSRVKGESSSRRSRSPADRSSRKAAKKERLSSREKSLDSDGNLQSSDARSQERKVREGPVSHRNNSPSNTLKTQTTSHTDNSSTEKEGESSASNDLAGVSARQTVFENEFLPSAAKVGTHLASVKLNSMMSEGRSPSNKGKESETKSQTTKINATKPVPVLDKDVIARSLRKPIGFSKEELQRILTTVKTKTNTKTKPRKAKKKPPIIRSKPDQSTTKEKSDPSTPDDEETHYISVVNDEQCSSDGESPLSPPKHADIGKPEVSTMENNLTTLETEDMREAGQISLPCLLKSQPNTPQRPPGEQSHSTPAISQPESKSGGLPLLPQPAPVRPKSPESQHGGESCSSEAVSESLTDTVAPERPVLNVTHSDPPLAATGNAASQEDESCAQRPSADLSSQPDDEKLKCDVILEKVQPKDDGRLLEETEKQEVVTAAAREPQTSQIKDGNFGDQEDCPDPNYVKSSEAQSEGDEKQTVASEPTEKTPLITEKQEDSNPEASDACIENKLQGENNESKPESGAPHDIQQSALKSKESIQNEGTIDPTESSGDAEAECAHKQEGGKEAIGNTKPSEAIKGGDSKPSVPTASSAETAAHRCSLCPVVMKSRFALLKHEKVCPKRVQQVGLKMVQLGRGGVLRQCPTCQRLVSNPSQHRAQCRDQCTTCGKHGMHICFARHPARRPMVRGQSPSSPRSVRPAGPPRGEWMGQRQGLRGQFQGPPQDDWTGPPQRDWTGPPEHCQRPLQDDWTEPPGPRQGPPGHRQGPPGHGRGPPQDDWTGPPRHRQDLMAPLGHHQGPPQDDWTGPPQREWRGHVSHHQGARGPWNSPQEPPGGWNRGGY